LSTHTKGNKDVQIPSSYIEYHQKISEYINDSLTVAEEAKRRGLDISEKVESQIGYDLPDRIAKIHEIDISSRLRTLLPKLGKELTALKISEEIALGKFGGLTIEEKLNNAVRVGLSVVTEGVTVAPLQGIYDVKIKSNANRTQYLSVSFAGPIRSAGGTEAAVTMLIADHVRKVVGLDKYIANSYDDEISRYVEELRIYEREVGNFQFKVSDKDVIRCIGSLPVEIDGVDTDPVEVVGHRNLQRVSTNRVRGGALRVMNDGLIGRSRKLLKLVETLNLEGWDWLKNLEGAIQTPEDDTVSHRMTEVITGRPVLSMQKKIGGFRLRYGRSCNTGLATIGIHPTIPILLNYAIAVGTQIKIDAPGKASTIALVDSIEPPIVKLNDGTVRKIKTISEAKSAVNKITKILYLGDILISYGDFLENNTQLLPSSYVEEIWALELEGKLSNTEPNSYSYLKSFDNKRLVELAQYPLEKKPSLTEALQISQQFDLPLYPGYVFYWSALTLDEFSILITRLLENKEKIKDTNEEKFITNDSELKKIFEKLGIFHSLCLDDSKIRIDDPDQLYILSILVARCIEYGSNLDNFLKSTVPSNSDPNYVKTHILDCISKLLNVSIKEKFSSSIAVRVGRPEKAADRKMKPPVHVLFPIGTNGGPTRDILKAMQRPLYIEIANRLCTNCKLPSISVCCQDCHSNTPVRIMCSTCRYEVKNEEPNGVCPVCGNRLKKHSPTSYPLKLAVEKAGKHLDIRPIEPLKGVKALMGKNRCAEPLEKGILRQKHNLYTFKDGTIRFDATNEPLTHFKPKWIKTDITKLRDLGYLKDQIGNDLKSEQLLELFIQDIIIPIHAAEHLVKIAQFIDEELTRFYGLEAFYKIDSIDDLIGHLIVGLAPHTSVGIIGRVIGFVNSQVCLGSPIWHSAKRRDCDGDADSIMLLMDIFLNFSKEYLPDRIGGLMDAPLLIQPLVFPHEVQRQAHNIDVEERYPLDFYRSSWNMEKTNVIDNIDLVKKRLGHVNQFFDYKFTHTTDNIMLDESQSLYSTLSTMEEKLKMQISTAKLINAVDVDEVMSMVLTTHILPDIMGNLRAYSSQSSRCTKCGQKYRRMPLIGRCLECNNELLPTVTRGSVEKYVQTALNICSEFKINEYLTSRINTLQTELNLLFKQDVKDQHTIIDFI
jgi:DNA polymerase II large subunit